MLTIHLLVKNNETTIRPALQSVMLLKGSILIGNMGSNDHTLAICKEFNAKIVPIKNTEYDAARNQLIQETQTPWMFYIQPWEVLAGGHEHLLERLIDKQKSYFCQIFQNNIISKEIRIWKKTAGLCFENPVYETIYSPDALLAKEIVIYSKAAPCAYDEQLKLISKWKKQKPSSPNPYYYEACILLQQKKYQEFISIANYYLFRETQGISAVMLKYYLSMVYCHLKNYKAALLHLVPCLSVRPLMAEFWCLLGDIHYRQNIYQKSKIFYENAICLGGQRDLADDWPIEIDKYKEHPSKMIESCLKIRQETKYYALSVC